MNALTEPNYYNSLWLILSILRFPFANYHPLSQYGFPSLLEFQADDVINLKNNKDQKQKV